MNRLTEWKKQITENLRRERLGLQQLGISYVSAKGVELDGTVIHLFVADVPIRAVECEEENENLLYLSKGGLWQ